MDTSKHRSISYTTDTKQARQNINNPLFIKLSLLDDSLYEFEMKKRKYDCSLPPTLGCNILNLAKLSLLKFYYNFVDLYFKKECFELVYVDTDSQYFALSSEDYKDIVKAEKYKEFHQTIYKSCGQVYLPSQGKFLLRECCQKCRDYDALTPGT